MSDMQKKALLIVTSFLLLGGCSLAPKYHRPDSPGPRDLDREAPP